MGRVGRENFTFRVFYAAAKAEDPATDLPHPVSVMKKTPKIEKAFFGGAYRKLPTLPSQNEIHLIVQVSKFSKKYKKTPLTVICYP